MTEKAPSPWQNFLSAFGETPEEVTAVEQEIHRFWQSEAGSPFPMDVYNHLVDARIESGKISHERGEFLKAYFAESFAPEQVTGYADKHREPLVTAMVEEYAKASPQNPIYRVEADIMNLGGLNKVLGEKNADRVIRFMSKELREGLERYDLIGKNDVCDIRLGGDELLLYVRPGASTNAHFNINKIKESVQNSIAVFAQSTGLENVLHIKPGRPRGVGIGIAAEIVDPKKTKLERSRAIEEGIKKAKAEFEDIIGVCENYSIPTIQSVNEYLDQLSQNASQRRSPKTTEHAPSSTAKSKRQGDGGYVGKSPEDARFGRMQRQMDKLPSADAAAESAALKGLHALTEHRDPVTGLLMFGDMEAQVLPNFKQRYALEGNQPKARLVHFDFNNLGGANLLGHWVGNEASQQFTKSIETAMAKAGLERYIPYLTSQSANKFALLLPMNVDEKKIEALNIEVEKELYRRMKQPLLFDAEELKYIHENMKAHPDKYPKAAQMDNLTHVTMLDMVNAKALKFKGSHVMCSHGVIDVGAPKLGDAIRALEKTVEQKHAKKDAWIERPKARTHIKVTKNGEVSYVERVERIPPNQRAPKALEIEDGKIIGPKALLELNRKANSEETSR